MEFCHIKAVKSAAATAVFALTLTVLAASPSFAQAATQQPAGQPPAGGSTTNKNWKDRAEYDLYASITKTTDPKARIDLLNQWSDKYPTSDYKADRAEIYCATYNQLATTDPATAAPKVFDYCKQAVDADPKYFQGYYFPLVWAQAAGGANPSPAIQDQVDKNAHAIIDQDLKPPGVDDAKWAQAKPQIVALAHKQLAWVDNSKGDTAGAENEYQASLQANPNDSGLAYQYGGMLQKDAVQLQKEGKQAESDKKLADALFEYARAATYAGPGALSPDNRQKALDYFNKLYKDFHGDTDGADQVIAQAKTAAVPPPDFKIGSAAAKANQEAKGQEDRMNQHPDYKLWVTIKTNLTAPDGQNFFNNTVKDAEIPGTAVPGVTSFSGTVISVDPPDKPTTITLGVDDPKVPDATLTFSEPINPVTPIKPGDTLTFSGVAASYTPTPYMLTFKDPTLPDTKLATARRTTVHGKRKR